MRTSHENAFVKPVRRSEDGCAMRKFRSFINSTCKTVLNLLEAIYLILWKTAVQTVTVVAFGVGNKGSDGRPTGYFRIKIKTNTTEFMDVRITGL